MVSDAAFTYNDSSIVFCSFGALFLPRFGVGEDAVSDLRFMPAAGFGDEFAWEEAGLILCAARREDDRVPAIVQRKIRQYGCSERNEIPSY